MAEDFSIKTFVKRNARTSEKQKQLYEMFRSVYCIDVISQTQALNFCEIFQNTNETIIEIGFGSGDATQKIALENPDKNYIAVDVFKTGVAKLISKIKEHAISNIRIIEYDAVEVLHTRVQDNSVNAFYIFFPDPWPKKRHHKRRLMQVDKIELMAKKLKPKGIIYFVTDWEPYAISALEALDSVPVLQNRYCTTETGFAEKQTWRPQTHFEKKAIDAGRSIFELIFEKRS